MQKNRKIDAARTGREVKFRQITLQCAHCQHRRQPLRR